MFRQLYPNEANLLAVQSGTDAAGWKARLAAIDWSTGRTAEGRAVFERRSCHRCHQVSGHLGPELKGAVSRMSRDDLFTAIFDPNLEVSPAFLTTTIATSAGQVYHGLVVYESPESTLLQTGPDTTVRVTNTETASMRKSTRLDHADRFARHAKRPGFERLVRLLENAGGEMTASRRGDCKRKQPNSCATGCAQYSPGFFGVGRVGFALGVFGVRKRFVLAGALAGR